MEKKRLLYVSPFPPLKSGISDYSVILANALTDKYDITLCIDDYKAKSDLDLPAVFWKNVDYSQYDYIIYNIGNNPEFHSFMYDMCLEHPGMIILHDLSLYYLFVGHYCDKGCFYSKLYEIEGLDTFLELKDKIKKNGPNLLEQKELSSQYRFNKEILNSDNKIMVHSQYALDRVKAYNDKARQINMIQQVSTQFELVEKKKLYSKHKIPMDAFAISSFGIIAETKLNHIACKIIKKIANEKKIKLCYIMVGEGGYADLFVDNETVFKTGFVDMNEFDSFIVHSDMVLNLRHPSMGETSAALIKILQMGKLCIINDEAWFSEIPDDCAVKLPVENIEKDLEEAILKYINNEKEKEIIEKNAKNYINTEYATNKIVDNIVSFLEE